jgi:hypothetical protein
MAKGRRQDHYEVLGVTPDAPEEVIRAAYKALAAKHHPDRNPGNADAELRLKRVNAAFNVIGNPEKRKQYDELTQTPEAPDLSTRAEAEEPRKEPARWKVPVEDSPRQPGWKHPGEEKQEQSVKTPAANTKPSNTGIRVLLAGAATAMSLYISFSHPSHSPYAEVNPGAHDFGVVVGCGALALFVYWLAGKISPAVCGLGLALLAAVSLSLHGGDEKPSAGGSPTPTTTAARYEPAATTAEVAVPSVPPLLPNEAPPSDGPNYFEPREMNSGGIVSAFDSCQSSAKKAGPTLNAELVSTYCTCVVDAMRRNLATTGSVTKATPSGDQISRCGTAARAGSPSPFGYASPRSTSEVWKSWTGCVQSNGEADHGVYCGCVVDLNVAAKANAHVWPDVPGKQTIPQLIGGCRIADQYWTATKTILTVRQFKALVVTLSPDAGAP